MMVDKIKNIALVSHTGAGKTLLTDMLAYNFGIVDRLGKAEEGTSVSDYTQEEQERAISINSSIFSFTQNDYTINLIDTPGYLEFIGEVIASLEAVDSAILLVDATSGVEIGTEKMWSFLKERNLPRFIFINKLDLDNINFSVIVDEIKKNFGKNCILFNIPDGVGKDYHNSQPLFDNEIKTNLDIDISSAREELIEAIAETQDDLLEEYLEKGELTTQQLTIGLKKAVSENKIIPIFSGSAGNKSCINKFTEYMIQFLPSPSEVKASQAFVKKDTDSEELEKVDIEHKEDFDFYARVFKTQIDPYIGQLSIFRVLSGKVNSNSQVKNINKSSVEKLGQLYLLQGKEQKPLETAIAGSIVAVAKLKDTDVSDTFCDGSKEIVFPEIKFPEPVLSYSITPESREDEKKISQSLKKITKEDKTFKVSRDSQTKELLISGMGNLHLEITASKLKQRFKVNVKLGTPKVPYKETIMSTVEIQHKYKKQSGGHGQYGDVCLRLVPLERGKGFEFEDSITGGAIPRQYIPSVEKGVRNAMQEGVVAGYPLVDFKAVLYDGSYHSVDSSDMAFQIAGAMALKDGVKKAKPVLLEPIMDVNIMVAEDFMGQINKDLNSRRGRIMGMEAKGLTQVINAKVPLSEMLKYASELKSITGGRGTFSMKFSHYEQIPSNLAEKVIMESKKQKEK